MKSILCLTLLLALQASDCGDAGRRQEDQRKDQRRLPATGDRVMVPGRNETGVMGANHDGVPVVKYSDGTQLDATTTQVVVMPGERR